MSSLDFQLFLSHFCANRHVNTSLSFLFVNFVNWVWIFNYFFLRILSYYCMFYFFVNLIAHRQINKIVILTVFRVFSNVNKRRRKIFRISIASKDLLRTNKTLSCRTRISSYFFNFYTNVVVSMYNMSLRRRTNKIVVFIVSSQQP